LRIVVTGGSGMPALENISANFGMIKVTINTMTVVAAKERIAG